MSTKPDIDTPVTYRHLLAGILLLALILRLWGIWNVEHTDEFNEVFEALRVDSGHFNYERLFKRFYLYGLAVEYAFYYAIGWLAGAFSSPLNFAEAIVRDMKPLFLMGRVTSMVAGVTSVYLLYDLGSRLYSAQVGLLASLTLALDMAHVEVSQHARVDATLILLILLCFHFLVRLCEGRDKRLRDCFWTGLLLGLAIQTKINAVVLICPVLLAYWFSRRTPGSARNHSGVEIAALAGSSILGFVLGNPPVVAALPNFILRTWQLSGVYFESRDTVSSSSIGFVVYLRFLFSQMGLPLFIFWLVGTAYALVKRSKSDILMLSFIIPFYLVMGATRYRLAAHYILPAIPFFFLIAWRLALDVSRYFENWFHSFRLRPALVISWVLLLPLVPGLLIYELSISGQNTRHLAKSWIERHIPPGSRILMDSGKSINSFSPPIAEDKATLQRTIARAEENIANGIIVHRMVDQTGLLYYKLLLKTVPPVSYGVTSTAFGLYVKDLSHYLNNGYEYFVISKTMAESYLYPQASQRWPQSAWFYAAVFKSERLELLQVISPSTFHAGDTFYIFRAKS